MQSLWVEANARVSGPDLISLRAIPIEVHEPGMVEWAGSVATTGIGVHCVLAVVSEVFEAVGIRVIIYAEEIVWCSVAVPATDGCIEVTGVENGQHIVYEVVDIDESFIGGIWCAVGA